MAAQKYFEHRTAGDVDACLAMVTDDIVMNSEKEGVVSGKKAFEEYLKKTPAQGTWGTPEALADGTIRIKGSVKFGGAYSSLGLAPLVLSNSTVLTKKIGFIPVTVYGKFTFDAAGKISKLSVGRTA